MNIPFSVSKIVQLAAVSFLTALLITACGGGGGGSGGTAGAGPTSSGGTTLSGSIIDAPVQGLIYSASPSGLTGTTDAQGSFKFKAGDSVSFSAAGVTLGSVSPALGSDGSAVVTPLSLTGEPISSSPKALAIARFLNTLNAISQAKGKAVSGAFVVPDDTGLVSKLAALGQSAQGLTTALLQNALDAAFGAGTYTVSSDADSLSGLNQGIGSVGFAGTVWRAVCPGCGGGTVFFKPNGEAEGFTDDGGLLSGKWSVSGSTITIYVVSSTGGYATGTLPVGASSGTLTLNQGSGGVVTLAVTKLTSSAALTSTYGGLWYGTFTPNSTGIANTFRGGAAYIVAAPDGKVYGLDDGGTFFSGSWTPATGIGSAVVSTDKVGVATISFDLSGGPSSLLVGGVSQGPVVFSRSGALNVIKNKSGSQISLLLPLVVNWANKSNSASSFALDVRAEDQSGNRVASTVKTMSTAVRSNGIRTTNTDNIALSYNQGAAARYRITFGDGSTSKDGCSITGGVGGVVDANSGNPAAYPTVTVNCN